jgi:hypothetical protein
MAAGNCREAVQALLDGRWNDWAGLPANCELRTLQEELGGSTVLDQHDDLGRDRIDCTRSSVNDEPITAWHIGETIQLIECDLLGTPRAAPASVSDTIHRLDVRWGVATLENGEWVMPARGLALIVTSSGKVVGARGFPPTSLADYIARLRPQQDTSLLPRPASPAFAPLEGDDT